MDQATAADPLIGAQVGNYKIRSKIGEGGMGSVYLAEHPRIGKKVALKILHSEFSANQDVTTRFFNEARAVNDIGHPNIVDIIDYGVIPAGGGEMVYFIMELLQGRSLSQVIRDESPMAPERSLAICLQIADALAASHNHKIVHRDLKPDNVIIQTRGPQHDFVKVLDFGIAKLTGDQPGSSRTRTGIVMGTPAYMSPEQCEGKGQVDHRTDVYALGIVLYEMLTGQVPFLGEGYGEILVQHLTAVPPRPSTIRGVVPPHVEAVCMKALEKKPGARYPSMEEFMLALRDPVGYVESHGGLAGFVSLNLGAPSFNPTPLPGHMPMATPVPGAVGYGYPTPPPMYTGQPTTGVGMGHGAVAPARSRTGLFVAVGVVGALAIAGGVIAMSGGGEAPPAAAAAPAPAAAAAPAAAPAGPAMVSIKVGSTPEGAVLHRGGFLVGNTPTSFQVAQGDAPIEIKLSAPGFVDRVEQIVPSQNRDLSLQLERVPVAPPPVAAAEPVEEEPSRAAASRRSSRRSERTDSSTTKSPTPKTGKTGSKVGNNTLAPDFD